MQPELPRNKQSEYQQKSAANLTIAALLLFRPGVEPGRVAPLVFETSASTDSAIWARKAGAKIRRNFEFCKSFS